MGPPDNPPRPFGGAKRRIHRRHPPIGGMTRRAVGAASGGCGLEHTADRQVRAEGMTGERGVDMDGSGEVVAGSPSAAAAVVRSGEGPRRARSGDVVDGTGQGDVSGSTAGGAGTLPRSEETVAGVQRCVAVLRRAERSSPQTDAAEREARERLAQWQAMLDEAEPFGSTHLDAARQQLFQYQRLLSATVLQLRRRSAGRPERHQQPSAAAPPRADASTQREREALLAGRPPAPHEHRPATTGAPPSSGGTGGYEDAREKNVVTMASEVTHRLRRTNWVAGQELERTRVAQTVLHESSAQIRRTRDVHDAYSESARAGKAALTHMHRRTKRGRWLVLAAFLFFLLVAAYVVGRRVGLSTVGRLSVLTVRQGVRGVAQATGWMARGVARATGALQRRYRSSAETTGDEADGTWAYDVQELPVDDAKVSGESEPASRTRAWEAVMASPTPMVAGLKGTEPASDPEQHSRPAGEADGVDAERPAAAPGGHRHDEAGASKPTSATVNTEPNREETAADGARSARHASGVSGPSPASAADAPSVPPSAAQHNTAVESKAGVSNDHNHTGATRSEASPPTPREAPTTIDDTRSATGGVAPGDGDAAPPPDALRASEPMPGGPAVELPDEQRPLAGSNGSLQSVEPAPAVAAAGKEAPGGETERLRQANASAEQLTGTTPDEPRTAPVNASPPARSHAVPETVAEATTVSFIASTGGTSSQTEQDAPERAAAANTTASYPASVNASDASGNRSERQPNTSAPALDAPATTASITNATRRGAVPVEAAGRRAASAGAAAIRATDPAESNTSMQAPARIETAVPTAADAELR